MIAMTRSICLAILAAIGCSAENLISRNSSFEVGMSGFEATPCAWVRHWPAVVQPRIDNTSAAHGRCSLRLDNGSGHDAMAVIFPPVQPGSGPLVFSFFARSDRPGTPIQAQLHCGYRAVLGRTISLDREWRRYEVAGTVGTDLATETANAGHAGWYAPVLRLLPPVGAWGTVWIDALQVERGTAAAPYAPAHAIDAGLDLADHARRRLLVYDRGEQPRAELLVATAPALAFAARWGLRDVLADRLVAAGELAGIADADGRALLPITLPPAERRLYRVEAEVVAAGATTSALRTYGGIVDRSGQPGGPFGISIESFEEARPNQLASSDPSYRLAHWHENPATYADLTRRVGWSWVHLYRQTSPLAVMPAPGTFRFEDTDVVVDLLRSRGLEVMALLSSHGNYNTPYDFPDWIKTGPKSQGGTARGRGAPLPDLARWERWCGAMAARYRGRITAWEIWNEPGVVMREEEYLPFAQAAWRAIKAADPQATVLGLCGTWDVGGDLYGWVKGCLGLGAGATMDAIAIHGYHCRERDYVSRVRELGRTAGGREFPVWDTETGYFATAHYDEGLHFAVTEQVDLGFACANSPAVVADLLTRHTLNELAHGVARLSYFNLSVPWTTLGRSNMGLINHDGSPDLGLICENHLIEALGAARPGRSLRCEGGIVAYVFERPEGPLGAYWCDNGLNGTAQLLLSKAVVADLLGGPLPTTSDGDAAIIPISFQPRFITVPGGDSEMLAHALEGMTLLDASPFAGATSRLTVDTDGRPALALQVGNRTRREQPLAIGMRSQPAWVKQAPAWSGLVPAEGSMRILLPLPTIAPDGHGLLRLALDNGRHVLAIEHPAQIAQATRAGQSARAIDLDGWASFGAEAGAQGLRLVVAVVDNSPAHYHDRPAGALEPWQGDCVELFLDLDRASDLDRIAFDRDDVQIICLPPGTTSGSVPAAVVAGNRSISAAELGYAAERTAAGWRANLLIPWSVMEAAGGVRGRAIGLAVSVRDVGADGQERRRSIWGGDNNNYRSTARYGLLLPP
jgi:hypothetical protein